MAQYDADIQENQENSRKCEEANSVVREKYNRDVFIVLVLAGLVTVVAGIIIAKDVVSSGLLFGGILNIIIGVIRYWADMQEYLRFVISGLALAVLIWVAYKKVKS